VARLYALPRDLAARLAIRRYGFHGLAHQFMARRFAAVTGLEAARIVTLQLGGGCSAAAISGVRPLDTSMGFTPLEGLVMSTRSGDLDPSLPLFIAARERLGPTPWKRSQPRVRPSRLAGASPDVRRLLELEAAGDANAKLRSSPLSHPQVRGRMRPSWRPRRLVSAAASARTGRGRARVCEGFEWRDCRWKVHAIERLPGSKLISSPTCARCLVTPVDEAAIIAAETAACIADTGG
jgi:acetate kinase